MHVIELSIVAVHASREAALRFLGEYETRLPAGDIRRRSVKPYPKFDGGFWYGWMLILPDAKAAGAHIRADLGAGWSDLDDGDAVWNPPADDGHIRWAILYAPDRIPIAEARRHDPAPVFMEGNTFIRVGTDGSLRR